MSAAASVRRALARPLRLAPLALAALLPACAHYVPTIEPALHCEPPPSLLTACSAPAVLKDGVTYADLLQAYQTDRQGSLACAEKQASLTQAIDACNSRIDQYNAALEKINAANSKH